MTRPAQCNYVTTRALCPNPSGRPASPASVIGGNNVCVDGIRKSLIIYPSSLRKPCKARHVGTGLSFQHLEAEAGELS